MYTKLFGSIIQSSIWSEDSDTRVMWITLLALQDREGYVFGSISGLARMSALPVKAVSKAMKKFLSPDPESGDLLRNPDHQGRRIEVIDGGWRILNAKYYNELKDAETRRKQLREAQARFRAKQAL